jgi:hypothetical protein
VNIQTALAAVMADVQSVAKNDRNTHQNFSFRGIDAVLNAVGPVLRKHGVVVLPEVMSHTFETVEVGQKRSLMGHVIVHVAYTFVGPEGDMLRTVVLGEAMDSGDKAVPKAMSVAFRTALLQALALPTDEPDPDSHTYERAAAPVADLALLQVEVEGLLAKADGLVDPVKVREYAAKGPAEAQASIVKLSGLLEKANG